MCLHTVPILDFSSLLLYVNLMKIWNPVAYSVSIYGSLYCFTSFLYMQGVSFFLFVRLLFQKKSDDLDFIGSRTLSRSPLEPSSSSQSSTPNTVYLRSDLDVSCDTSSAEKISDELSDSNPESNNKQMRATIPKIGS